MEFTLGISPCPNDTFIFDALVNNKIDTGGISFQVALEDVQTLNEWALAGKLDFTKLSYGVLPLVVPHYTLMESGGALGTGVGPLLIAKKEWKPEQVNGLTIGIPGRHTTAHLLFQLAFPGAAKKKFMIFHEIEEAVISGKVDAGVIIHENRFTYEQKGLKKILDLGSFWEEKLHCPIPLGAIVAGNRIAPEIRQRVTELIRKSITYSWNNYPVLSDYVRNHAQEMEEDIMRKHIELYVNNYSLDLGETGQRAVGEVFRLHRTANS
jgi:1,4-dihydroxy-6-naphthoate synthase